MKGVHQLVLVDDTMNFPFKKKEKELGCNFFNCKVKNVFEYLMQVETDLHNIGDLSETEFLF